MSSDTSVVTVLRVEGSELDLRIRTETAGGLNDYSLTRSFALLLVHDAWLRARDVYGYGFKSGQSRPIDQEAKSWPSGWYGSEDFFKENVGRYVEETEVLGRLNFLNESDPKIFEHLDQTRAAAKGLDPTLQEDKLCEVFHVVFLRVRMTDPKWLEGLEPGLVFGSTAYDVWWNDPKRPDAPDVERLVSRGEAGRPANLEPCCAPRPSA